MIGSSHVRFLITFYEYISKIKYNEKNQSFFINVYFSDLQFYIEIFTHLFPLLQYPLPDE